MVLQPGTMVRITPSTGFTRGYVNLHDPQPDGYGYIENGERLFNGETGLIIQSISTPYKTNTDLHHTYHRILTPRGTAGWIHQFHLEEVK